MAFSTNSIGVDFVFGVIAQGNLKFFHVTGGNTINDFQDPTDYDEDIRADFFDPAPYGNYGNIVPDYIEIGNFDPSTMNISLIKRWSLPLVIDPMKHVDTHPVNTQYVVFTSTLSSNKTLYFIDISN